MLPTPPLVVGLIVVLEGLSAFAAIFLAYAAFLTIRSERKNRELPNPLNKIIRGCVFLIAVALSLVAIHAAANSCGLATATATLFLTFLICSGIYFGAVRAHWEEDRVQYTVMLWAIYWIVTGLLILFVSWLVKQDVTFALAAVDSQSFAQYVATFAQVAGIIIAATMVVVTNRHNAKEADETSKQQIYQTLELESVKLFRFECDHSDLVELLWLSTEENAAAIESVVTGKRPFETVGQIRVDRVKIFQLKEYTCQILNLFEMACKFCKQDIMDADILGSWVVWMWDISCLPVFGCLWTGAERLRLNYVTDLRDIMNAGIHFGTDRRGEVDELDRLNSFYHFVADRMFEIDEKEQRELVRNWLTLPTDRRVTYRWVPMPPEQRRALALLT